MRKIRDRYFAQFVSHARNQQSVARVGNDGKHTLRIAYRAAKILLYDNMRKRNGLQEFIPHHARPLNQHFLRR